MEFDCNRCQKIPNVTHDELSLTQTDAVTVVVCTFGTVSQILSISMILSVTMIIEV